MPEKTENYVQRLTKDSELIVFPKTHRVIQGPAPEIFVFVKSYLFDTQVPVGDEQKIYFGIRHLTCVNPQLVDNCL